jgi:hypothetical protein
MGTTQQGNIAAADEAVSHSAHQALCKSTKWKQGWLKTEIRTDETKSQPFSRLQQQDLVKAQQTQPD